MVDEIGDGFARSDATFNQSLITVNNTTFIDLKVIITI